MKKTILGLTLATTTLVALPQAQETITTRIRTALVAGAQHTGTFVQNGVTKSRELAGQGTTFVGNHKFKFAFAAATFAGVEGYNWYKGKQLYTARAWDWTKSSWAGQKTASCWATFKSWFAKKSTELQIHVDAVKKEVLEAISYDPKAFEALQSEVKNISSSVNDLDLAVTNINKKLGTTVTKGEWLTSQQANVDVFATKEEIKSYASKEDALKICQDANSEIAALKKDIATIRETLENIQKLLSTQNQQQDNTSAK